MEYKTVIVDEIIQMVKEIENIADLEMLYGFTKAAHNDFKIEKAEED